MKTDNRGIFRAKRSKKRIQGELITIVSNQKKGVKGGKKK